MSFKDEYKNNGYTILRDVYSPNEVEQIKNIVNSLDIESYEHSKDKNGYPFRITNILPKNQNLKKIIEKPEVLKILKECIGDDVIFFKDKYISKKKGGRGEFVPIDPDDTADAKTKNRRIEVILTPKLDELFELLNSN